VAIDPTGKFAYVVNDSSNDVSAYTIEASSGALTQVQGSPFATGSVRPVGRSIRRAGSRT
jgi:6-phosphogluconolactonase